MQGSIDIPLDEVGLWQVNQSAQSLIKLYVLPDPSRHQLVVSSDLERSMQTAHAFADRLGSEVHADERLRERHFGEFEGRSGAYLQANFPQDFDSWCRGMGGEMNHGAESHEHAGVRSMEAMNDWAHECDDDTDLFVFSHGALIENALQVLFGIERRYPDVQRALGQTEKGRYRHGQPVDHGGLQPWTRPGRYTVLGAPRHFASEMTGHLKSWRVCCEDENYEARMTNAPPTISEH